MKEPTYVDWDGLKYYDTQIKGYVDEKVSKSDTKINESVTDLDSKISKIEADVARLDERSAALTAEISENEHAIIDLFDKVTDVQQRVSTNTADIENNKEAIVHDHELIEQLLVDIENKSNEGHKHNASDIVDLIVPDLNNYITRPEVTEQIATSLQGYATEQFVREKILEAEIAGEDVDLSDYYTKSEVEALIPSVEGLASEEFVATTIAAIEFPEVPTKVSELENDAGYVRAEDIPETDLSDYYNKTETENLIAEAVKDIEPPTVDLEGYATEEWVNGQGFLKEHQDLSDYAKKSDIPEAELFVVDYSAPDFTAAYEAYINGKLLLLTNAAPDANGYAILNYVRSDLITFTKFLTSRSETYGSFNTYYLHNDNTWEVSSEVKLNKVEANVSEDATFNLTTIKIGKETYRIPTTNLDNYYNKAETKELVDTAVAGIEIPVVDLTPYATTQFVSEQVSTLATKKELQDAIDSIEYPTVDLSEYAKLTDLSVKADAVPFKEDMRVGTPVGGFSAEDSLKDMTIADILTKLLNLTLYQPPVTPEGILDGTPTVAVPLIKNNVPSYMLGNSGDPVCNTYEYRTMTTDESKLDNQTESFLYQVVSDNKAIETGYQIVTEFLDNGYLTVYIPETITNFSIKVYDGTRSDWVSPDYSLIRNNEYKLEGYVAYTADPAFDIYESTSIRIIIND